MPYVMNYTDSSGVNYPASFWLMVTNSQNHLGRTMSVAFNGYKTVGDFNLGMDPIAQQTFLINGPDYDTRIKARFEAVYLADNPAYKSFQFWIEAAVRNLSTFFSTAIPSGGFSSASVVSLLAGAGFSTELDTRVTVTFSSQVGNQTPGVTIKVNGVARTITGSALIGNTSVQYDFATPIGAADVVTWEYDSSVGSIIDQELRPVRSFSALPVVNQAGESLQFDSVENSIWLASRA